MSVRKKEIITRLDGITVEGTERAALEQELQDIIAEEQAMSAINLRFEEQEEKVQSITLPYNFDELYKDSTANKSIIEVVQLFLRAAIKEHNNEVQAIVDTHREEQRAAADRELQLKRQNDGMQNDYILVSEQLSQANKSVIELQVQFGLLELANNENLSAISQLRIERDDALTKRDAAVREKEGIELMMQEKQEHIKLLRDEMAIGASRAINVTEVKASDRLAALVEQSKNAKIKSSVELALERLEPVRGKIDVAVAAPKLPEAAVPSDTVANELDYIQVSGVPANDQEVTFQLPSANAPEVPSLGPTMAARQFEAETDNGVTKTELEERLKQFASEFGLVKGHVA